MEISARNQLKGTISVLAKGEMLTEVTLDLEGGQQVVGVITRASAERLDLKVGDAATAIIKATEVMIAR